jgi:dihydroorotase
LVDQKVIDLPNALSLLNERPAAILGLNTGKLAVGLPADICIFDLKATWLANTDNWRSEGINTPFWGETLTGRVTHTLKAGKIIFNLANA